MRMVKHFCLSSLSVLNVVHRTGWNMDCHLWLDSVLLMVDLKQQFSTYDKEILHKRFREDNKTVNDEK